jgi:hypothetical protein
VHAKSDISRERARRDHRQKQNIPNREDTMMKKRLFRHIVDYGDEDPDWQLYEK